MRTIERLLVIAFASALLPAVGSAQGGRAVIPPPRRPAARAALKAERQAQRNDSAQPPLGERALLQRQVRQAWMGNVRRQLNLNNVQMRTLNQVNTKYERQRGEIQRDERQARLGLKAAMEDTAAADQNARIEQQMNVLVGAQRRRADLFRERAEGPRWISDAAPTRAVFGATGALGAATSEIAAEPAGCAGRPAAAGESARPR